MDRIVFTNILTVMLFLIVSAVGILVALFFTCQVIMLRVRCARKNNDIGFFHPPSAMGGGGERVLWLAIKGIQELDAKEKRTRRYVLYTKSFGCGSFTTSAFSQHARKEHYILDCVKRQFNVQLRFPLQMVFLSDASVSMLDPSRYPRFTLILQTLIGGFAMFFETAVKNIPCGTMVDTVGTPGVYPFWWLFCGTKIVAYVHYPVISTDMISRVENMTSTYNNSNDITCSTLITWAKLLYYRAFTWVYCFLGFFVSLVITNSSWTNNHIQYMWKKKSAIIFPPCNVRRLLEETHDARKNNIIISLGQFRPEKNHSLQLRIFARAKRKLPDGIQLIIAGGTRNELDEIHVETLIDEAKSLNLEIGKDVVFMVSKPYDDIVRLLKEATVGIHTMTDEHFGIVIVEYMAAGVVPLVHNSGGPKLDIVTNSMLGRRASSEDEFVEKMVELLTSSESVRETIRVAGRDYVRSKFSDETFVETFCSLL